MDLRGQEDLPNVQDLLWELDPRMSRSGGDGDLPTRPTLKDEIMAMDNLLDFKHDMKKIDKAKLKILEKKKKSLRNDQQVCAIVCQSSKQHA